MNLENIYEKPIDRHIEGVIKADDETGLRNEVEEYVLTDEAGAALREFLTEYSREDTAPGTTANGVWISGFFGSGKSHLLKMLALLMENRPVEDIPVLELFLPKCGSNPGLKAALEKTAAIPSRGILFNIDQKAVIITKSQVDALLSVFVKVFDDMCGYYGKQGYIAQFERDLDRRGQYNAFKDHYRDIAQRDWEQGRELVVLEARNIDRAYAAVSGEEPPGDGDILSKYRGEYNVSIEDFAANVNDYILEQEPHFRLNFFVDEVGQYIAGNVKLMTNLQTIAESLATRCRGRAWLLVTAQEDMEQVIGQMKARPANDFSKISDRFKYKLKLTSKNVAEVIQKRLLLKKKRCRGHLETLYNEQHNNFRTLFDFSDGSMLYKNYAGKEHFVAIYPFVPYQFELFQQAIRDLSNHDAFEGRHKSVGERSMLAVFQHAARALAVAEPGALAPFHILFDGIRGSVKSNLQHGIPTAEKNLENSLAVRILKALFLVKYIKGFKASVRNIRVLMTENCHRDISALQTDVQQALNLLEQQSYILRDGEFYQYLTNEEKDVEKEIKMTQIENVEITTELANIVFQQVSKGKQRKISWERDRHYTFARKIDGRLLDREQELSILVSSPFHAHLEKEDHIISQAMVRDELLVLMPQDERLVHDLSMHLKTQKYIRLNSTNHLRSTLQRILGKKQGLEHERLERIKERVRDLPAQSRLFVGGKQVEARGEDPVTIITAGFRRLVERTYINLPMLNGVTYHQKDIAKLLTPTAPLEYGEPEQALLAEITKYNHAGRGATLHDLSALFLRKPYGWPLWTVPCLLAKLLAGERIDIRYTTGHLQTTTEIETALLNTREWDNIFLAPRASFDPLLVHNLKEFYQNYFHVPPGTSEPRALGQNTHTAFRREGENVRELVKVAEQRDYPFHHLLREPLKRIAHLGEQSYDYYLNHLEEFKDKLLKEKEELLDPIARFSNGPAGKLYLKIARFHREQRPNYPYIGGEEHKKLEKILSHPHCFENNRMQKAEKVMTALEEQIAHKRDQETVRARQEISTQWQRLASREEFLALPAEKQRELKQPFDRLLRELNGCRLISTVRDKPRRFREEEYPSVLQRLKAQTAPPPLPSPPSSPSSPSPPLIGIGSVPVTFDKPWIEAPADVRKYVEALERALLTQLQEGKHIHL